MGKWGGRKEAQKAQKFGAANKGFGQQSNQVTKKDSTADYADYADEKGRQ